MRKILLLGCLAVVLWACNSDSTADGGTDATTESSGDLCDLNAFLASGGAGHACPRVSTRVCFPLCIDAGGCMCVKSDAGPVWECDNGNCSPCGNSSPEFDAGDCGTDASDDASDASIDAADGG